MNPYITQLNEKLAAYRLRCDGVEFDSVLELLWECYSNANPIADDRVKQCEAAIAPVYEAIPLDASNQLFIMIYDVCAAYQRAAFLEGIHIGAALAAGLQ